MQLPKATTVTEKYLKAIYDELRKMNQSYEVKPAVDDEGLKNVLHNTEKKKEEPVELQGYERLTCDICGKKFKTDASLKAHKTKMHK